MRLFGERAFAPIDPAVGAGVGAVQVVRAAGERFPLVPFDPLVGDAIAVFIREFPNTGRSGNIERAVKKQGSLRKHQVVRKNSSLVELTVAIRVFNPNDAMRL